MYSIGSKENGPSIILVISDNTIDSLPYADVGASEIIDLQTFEYSSQADGIGFAEASNAESNPNIHALYDTSNILTQVKSNQHLNTGIEEQGTNICFYHISYH